MTAFVQPRHIKLGLAGAAQNWAYAAHELHELQETFDNIAKLVSKHGKLSVPDTITATVTHRWRQSIRQFNRKTYLHSSAALPT
jgi:hypothetical protein